MKQLIVIIVSIWAISTPIFAQNWHAFLERGGQPDMEVPFCSVVQNGELQLSQPNMSDYWTKFRLDDTILVNNNFAIEVRLRNSSVDGGIQGYDTGMYLEGCGIDAGATLMGELQAIQFTSIYAGSAAAFERPELVLDFTDWVILTFVFRNNTFYALRNGNIFFTLPYTGEITFVEQILLRFKGAGKVDYLKLYNENGQTIWQEDFNTCNAPIPFPNPPQFTLIASNDTSVCKGESLSLTANLTAGSNYQWSGPQGFTSSQATVFLNTINPSDTGLYQVTANYKGCIIRQDSVRVSLNVLETPLTNFLGKDTTLCLGDSLILGRDYPCATYRWQNGSTDATLVANKAGSYNVEIEVDNQIFRDTIQIDYYSLPQINLGKDTTLCPGESISLNASLPIPATYRWQDGSTNPIYVIQNPGYYIAIITDLCGNSTADSIQVDYYKTLKTLDLGNDTTLCPGESLVIDAFDDAAITYRWQDGSTNPTFTASTDGIYAVTTRDNCNNIETDSIEIQYFKLIKPFNLGKDTTLCPGETITLHATDSAAIRYEWNNGNTDSILTVQSAGNYAVTITDACGNQFSDSIQVNYYKVLNPLDLGRDTTLCPAQTLLLSAFDSAAVIYRWQDGSRNPTYLVNQPGNYIVYIADNCGNTATDIIYVSYYDILQNINLGSDTTLCPGETITLDASDKAARFYRWQNGSRDSVFIASQPGTYSVQVTDNCGNTLSDAIKVEYHDLLNSLHLGNDTLLCPGSFILLNAFDAAAISYQWQDGSSQANFKVESPGTYAVTLRDNCNNIEIDSLTIDYYKLITNIDIGSPDTVLCEGEILILDASSEAQGTYRWQDGTTTPTYAVTKPGIYQVEVNDYCGNSVSDEIRIRYMDVPKPADLGSDTLVCEGEVFRLNATAPNATFYRWQDGLNEAIYPVTKPGFYSVTVGNVCGNAIYSLTIDMEYCGPCRTFVPTAFSPNGDGNNDVFQMGTECNFTHYEMRIFNRWGVQVFGTITPWTYWDGTLNGSALPAGVYVWQLRYKADDGSAQTLSGDVLLMR